MTRRGRWTTRTIVGGLLGCVALFAGGYYLYVAWTETKQREAMLKTPRIDDPLRHEVLGPSLYYRFVYDGLFEGQRIEIKQLIECRPYLSSSGKSLRYERRPNFTGQRLADGSAIYFKLPDLCGGRFRRMIGKRDGRPQYDWKVVEPVEVLPLTFWIDNVDKPTLVEVYAAPGYYREPEARLEFKLGRIEFHAVGFAPTEKPRQPFEVPAGRVRWNTSTGLPTQFWGGWQLFEIGRDIRGILPTKPLAVSASGRFKVYATALGARAEYFNRRAYAQYSGHIRVPGWPLNLPGLFVNPGDAETLQEGRRLFDSMIAFRWAGNGRYEASLTPRGRAILHAETEQSVPLHRGQAATLVIDGDPVELNLGEIQVDVHRLVLIDTATSQSYVVSYWF